MFGGEIDDAIVRAAGVVATGRGVVMIISADPARGVHQAFERA
jgi:hypothetical protein